MQLVLTLVFPCSVERLQALKDMIKKEFSDIVTMQDLNLSDEFPIEPKESEEITKPWGIT